MIKSIVREHKWTFLIIEEMFLDEQDFKGIEFWYQDIKEVTEALKPKK